MSAKIIDWTKARIARGLAPPLPPGVPAYGSPPRNDDCIVHEWDKVPITADYAFCKHCGLTSRELQPLLPPRRRCRPAQPIAPTGPLGGAS